MTEEKKQQTLVGLLAKPDTQQQRVDESLDKSLTEHNSCICYLCGCRISAKLNTDYKCPRCGNRACSSCLELTDIFHDVCLSCDSKANKCRAMWDTIALVGIVIVVPIVLCLLLMDLFPEHRQTLF